MSNENSPQGRFRAHAGLQPKHPLTPGDSHECVSHLCLWNRDYLFRPSYSKASPCEDFYEHACGGFRYSPGGFSQQPYPRWSTGQLLLDLDMFFKRFLAIKGRQPRPIESNFLVQAMWLHGKCMNRSENGKALSAWATILDVLGLTGWPFLEFKGDLVALVSSGDRHLMLQTLYRVIILTNARHPAPSRITLKRPLTYLERFASLSRDASSKRYEGIIVHALSISGNKSVGIIAGRQIAKLEESLHSLVYLGSKHVQYVSNDLWSVDALPKSTHWDWLRYMKLLFKTETLVNASTVVFLEDPLFFTRMSSIFKMQNYKTAVANYVGLKALVTLSPLMPSEYRLLYEFTLGSNINHFDSQLAACGTLLESMYRYGVGIAAKLTSNGEYANVYRTHLDDQFAAFFDDIRSTLRDMLQSGRSWFSHDDVNTAQRKLLDTTFVYGTQDNFVQYESYRRTPTLPLNAKKSVLETTFSIFSYSSSLYWGAVANGGGQNVTAAYDNAYTTSIFAWDSEYQPTNNLVFAPNALVGFLSTFSSTVPYQLYPAVLTPLVKAYLQALLRSNSHFDERMLPKKWWSEESIEAYHNITQCLRHQYETRAIGDEDGNDGNSSSQASVRFTVTRLEQDFLDNAVLSPLYQLYEQALIKHKATQLYYNIPHVRVSARELFFYNYAWVFCDNTGASSQKLQETIAMTPAKLRLNVALSNFPPFLRTFSCSKRKRQGPRCEVWKRF
ncbi:hypothetical protein MRX96_054888 [Rhipicephalus microplus]